MANDLTWVFRFTIEALVRIGGISAYMFYRSWRLALVAAGVIPVVAVVNRFYGAWMAQNAKQVQEALANANAVAHEALSAMRTVFSFASERHELDRYTRCVQRHYALNVRQTAISGVYYMVCCTFLMSMCVQAALLCYGSHLVWLEQLSPNVLLAFMLYQGQLQEYFGNLLNSFTNLLKSAGAGVVLSSDHTLSTFPNPSLPLSSPLIPSRLPLPLASLSPPHLPFHLSPSPPL